MNAECGMRNAEWICRHWLDRRQSWFDLGTAIPHSRLRISHSVAPTALAVIGTGAGVLSLLLRR